MTESSQKVFDAKLLLSETIPAYIPNPKEINRLLLQCLRNKIRELLSFSAFFNHVFHDMLRLLFQYFQVYGWLIARKADEASGDSPDNVKKGRIWKQSLKPQKILLATNN